MLMLAVPTEQGLPTTRWQEDPIKWLVRADVDEVICSATDMGGQQDTNYRTVVM